MTEQEGLQRPGAGPPFVGCTGRGVRIAIVDSGVHPDHDHIAARNLVPGLSVLSDGSFEEGDGVTLDRLGHGTAVTAAIQQRAPEATCLPVRVFRDALRTSAAALIAAIDWAVEQGADIVNLSLGSPNTAHREAFAAAARRARDAGVVIVAARHANGVPCHPGMLDDVIGVDLDWDCPRALYRAEESGGAIVIRAAGYPRDIPGVAPRRNIHGISFSVAHVSGFAALACERLAASPSDGDRVSQVGAMLRAGAAGQR